jgi:tRNA(Ile)-lysidine synthase
VINITHPIPRNVTIAFSGGVDSVAVADFLRVNHSISLLYIDHCDQARTQELNIVKHYAQLWSVPLQIVQVDNAKPKDQSQEEHWRHQRYNIFHSLNQPIITCHHLDDCVETWIWSSLHGRGRIIPAINKNVIRPFRTTPKSELVSWCVRRGLRWAEDASNEDTKHIRNYIRHNLVPHALHVNPGLHKTIRKKILTQTT